MTEPDRTRVSTTGTRQSHAITVMFCVAALVLAADTISKTLVLRDLPGHPPVRLLDGLITLRLLYNPGAAFGLGTSYTVVIALIAVGVIVFVIRTARRLGSTVWSIALGLLLGGATGNLSDRLVRAPGPFRGHVVDWINLPHFPWTFNLADSAIVCAAVLIGFLAFLGKPIQGATAPPPAAPAPSKAQSGDSGGGDSGGGDSGGSDSGGDDSAGGDPPESAVAD
jgi:lipoprotein signal peptidase